MSTWTSTDEHEAVDVGNVAVNIDAISKRFEKTILTLVPIPTSLVVLASLWAVFLWVPTERHLGIVQRIFYYHVPSALACYVGFIIAALASMAYLARGKIVYDHMARAGVEVGMLFASMVLITGPLWAKPSWGTYWTWDARLTTMFVLWLVYFAYLLLRAFSRDDEMGKRFAAVLAIIGTLDIPLIVLATRLWQGAHPAVLQSTKADSGLKDPAMGITLGICMIAFALLFTWLWTLRFSVLRMTETIEDLEYRSDEALAP